MSVTLLFAVLKVLAVGNSFSYCTQHQLPQVAKSLGRDLDLATMTIWGCPLNRHWECLTNDLDHSYFLHVNRRGNPNAPWPELDGALKDMEETDEVKQGLSPRRGANLATVLKAERWDVIVMHQTSPLSWRPETYRPWGVDLVRSFRNLVPQVEVLVQETWSYTPWDERLAQWRMTPDEMYVKLHAAYLSFAAEMGLRIIPMGAAVQAWRKALPVRYADNSLGGDVCGSAKFERDESGKWIHKGDACHLNDDGFDLQALVWAAALFNADVSTCKYAPPGLAPERAKLMRAICSNGQNR